MNVTNLAWSGFLPRLIDIWSCSISMNIKHKTIYVYVCTADIRHPDKWRSREIGWQEDYWLGLLGCWEDSTLVAQSIIVTDPQLSIHFISPPLPTKLHTFSPPQVFNKSPTGVWQPSVGIDGGVTMWPSRQFKVWLIICQSQPGLSNHRVDVEMRTTFNSLIRIFILSKWIKSITYLVVL